MLGKKPVTKKLTPVDWRSELVKDPLIGREKFCKLCVTAIQELVPDAALEPIELPDLYRFIHPNAEPQTISFQNIWSQTKTQPDVRLEQVERFIRVLTASGNKPEALPDRNSIVAVIKNEEYLNVSRNKTTGELPFVNEYLVGDLWVVFAVDMPDAIKTLSKTEAIRMKLDLSELKPLAIKNLKRILPPIQKHEGGLISMLTAGGDYVASLILFDDLWEELQATVDGNIIAAIPSRDVLLFTGSNSKEGITRMRSTIEKIIGDGGYLISNVMLRRTLKRWDVFS
ncbi:MAG TPA: DUF1444 family protein [Candidatus Angelobacter sp.]|nr:DUF1444 family protein [Candidatus Angelobacter sp.]